MPEENTEHTMDDILISNTLAILPVAGKPEGRRCSVAVKDGRIRAILPPEARVEAVTVIDGSSGLLTPGLVNAHTHAYMTGMRCWADDLQFDDWLFGRVMPKEDALTPEDAYWFSLLGCLEMLSGGENLLSRREALLSERSDAQRQYDAIALALSELEKADEELRRRYSPALSELTESYFRKLTGDKYSEVLLDRELSALLTPSGGTLRRESAFLSRGAQDQLFLSLRLALCTLLSEGEEKCPIVLDDALLSFDDERLGYALSLLEELGRERQIVLFSCSDREERILHRREEDTVLR